MHFKLSTIIIALALNFYTGFCLADSSTYVRNRLKELLDQGGIRGHQFSIQGVNTEVIENNVLNFYEDLSFNLFWTDYKLNLNYKYNSLKQAIAESAEHGLNPDEYSLDIVLKQTDAATADILLTLTAIKLAADAHYGRYRIRQIDSQNFKYNQLKQTNLQYLLRQLILTKDISAFINSLYPSHSQYKRMKQALRQYREKKQNDHIPLIKAGSPVKAGSSGEQIYRLSVLLQAYGDYKGIPTDTYNQEIADAIKKFQKRHGIPATGEVHEKTFAALSQSIDSRIKSLIINLERWRFLSREFSEGKEIFVNIAGYELFALENGKVKHRLTTVVGKPFQATPVFSDMIEYIEFNPYWNVPPSIVTNEILAKQRAKPDYLKHENIRIYSEKGTEIPASSLNFAKLSASEARKLRFRQDYGPSNVLGKLKFVFPNPFNIFLHDTSSPGLFDQNTRAFSHGCIRVKQPVELAAFLLDSPEDRWNVERVKSVLSDNKNINIKLPIKIPIHITYRTAWVEADSVVNFREDIYSRDKMIIKQLADSL